MALKKARKALGNISDGVDSLLHPSHKRRRSLATKRRTTKKQVTFPASKQATQSVEADAVGTMHSESRRSRPQMSYHPKQYVEKGKGKPATRTELMRFHASKMHEHEKQAHDSLKRAIHDPKGNHTRWKKTPDGKPGDKSSTTVRREHFEKARQHAVLAAHHKEEVLHHAKGDYADGKKNKPLTPPKGIKA